MEGKQMEETIKAKEIIKMYRNSSGCYEDQVTNALIHVNGIIDSRPTQVINVSINSGIRTVSTVEFWQKVKQEIEQTKI